MWNERKSLVLSKVCVALFAAALLGIALTAPWFTRWVIGRAASLQAQHYPYFLATLYTGVPPAALLLFYLYRLLSNIGKSVVFEVQNARYLRHISWCCFFGTAICAVSALYYLPWALVGLAAAFVGLIVRIVKNVFAHAIVIKEENDLTV